MRQLDQEEEEELLRVLEACVDVHVADRITTNQTTVFNDLRSLFTRVRWLVRMLPMHMQHAQFGTRLFVRSQVRAGAGVHAPTAMTERPAHVQAADHFGSERWNSNSNSKLAK